MIPLKNTARIAGIGYLIIFITGIFSNFFVLENLIVPDNAVATANNIINNDTLYRIGIFSFIIMVIFDVLLAWALYVIFIPVNKYLSLLSGWLRLVNATIFGIALINLLNVLQFLNGAAYLKVFTLERLYARVLLSLSSFNVTWLIGLVFFGFHLLILGYLIYTSGCFPKPIGILLVLAGIGYLIDSFANFLLPFYADYKDIFLIIVIIPGIIGELSLTFWLFFKSVTIPNLKEKL